LVEWQIRVARGEVLPFKQEDLRINGHAMEVRVYAEDPRDNFLPSVGTLTRYQPPVGANIRVDDGFTEGMDIPIYYDPMIAKLITWGETRAAAISKMREAIAAYEIEGCLTTLPFGRFVMEHPKFLEADFDTHFVQNHYTPAALDALEAPEAELAATIALKLHLEQKKVLTVPVSGGNGAWEQR
jgi:pyruvate carboxylase subunit A